MMTQMSFRAAALAGALGALVGVAGLTLFPGAGTVAFLIYLTLFGIGAGISATTYVVGSQHAVGWSERGVTTAASWFARSMGGTIGVAVLGAVLTTIVAAELQGIPGASVDVANQLLDPRSREALSPALIAAASAAIASASAVIFAAMTVVGVIAVVPALLMPGGRPNLAAQPATATPIEGDRTAVR
jgi:hypothetical protein